MNRLKTLSLLCAAVVVFTGCTNQHDKTPSASEANVPDGSAVIVSEGVSEYSIVTSQNAEQYELEIAAKLQTKLSELGGTILPIVDDTAEHANEILVGTARRAHQGLKNTEYRTLITDDGITLGAMSEMALNEAYNVLVSNMGSAEDTVYAVNTDIKDEYKPSAKSAKDSQLIKYPEYSEQAISRDYDYCVRVKQGEKTIELPVYNCVTAPEYFSSMYNSDTHRRFAEFAFSGDPVTVEITVNLPFDSVSVMPSSEQIKTTVNGNVVTYVIDKPQTTMLRLNDNKDTILAIFAQRPEAPEEIPDKNDPNVIFFEAGYHEVEGGTIKLSSGQTLYLAPGALVKARVSIIKAQDVTVCGRGAIMESSPTRMAVDSVEFMCKIVDSERIKLDGVKFLDARTFNIIMQTVSDIEISNVKVLANQISTDGLSWWSRNGAAHVHDCFWHIGDDVFVISGESTKPLIIENCIVGSDHGTFAFSNYTGKPVTFKNIDVFRSGRMFKGMSAHTLGMKGADIITENIYAEDVVTGGMFMDLDCLTNIGRSITIKNFSAPKYKKTTLIFDIDDAVVDAKISVENLWIGGKQFASTDGWFVSKLKNGNEITFVDSSDSFAAMAGMRNTAKTEKYTPMSVYINAMRIEPAAQPYIEDNTAFVSVKEILEKLDFEDITLSGSDLTFNYKDETYKLTAGSTDAVGKNGQCTLSAAPILKNGVMFVPLTVFQELLNINAKYDVGNKRVTVENIDRGGNLLRNPGIEEGLTTDWTTRAFTELYLSEEAHTGNYSINTYMDQDTYASGDANGIYQDVVDTFRRYGAGTYKLTAYVKRNGNCTAEEIELGLTRYFSTEGTSTRVKLTDKWQKIEYIYTLKKNAEDYPAAYFYIGYSKGDVKNVLIDDLSLEKIA